MSIYYIGFTRILEILRSSCQIVCVQQPNTLVDESGPQSVTGPDRIRRSAPVPSKNTLLCSGRNLRSKSLELLVAQYAILA